jgi:3',5'-cyclic AMP phosphodiesterase CpdA
MNPMNNRRNFITKVGLAAAAIGATSLRSFAFNSRGKLSESKDLLRIGWITDLHHGYIKDATQRLEAFMEAVSGRQLDLILQGGDFCHPTAEAKTFVQLWEQFKGDRYHVLGNHDMDHGTKEQVMGLWGMKDKYYSFDKGGFHFVVMDCNYILKDGKYVDYANSNYYIDQASRDLVNPEQIEWLKADLAATDKQTIIISHQAFDEIWDGWSVPNRHLVRKVIDDANNRTDFQKVIACFCGHHHLDDHSYINKVHYFQMNSASYYYTGDGFGSDGSKSVYKDPLYAFVTIDPAGQIIIEGKKSDFMKPTPYDTQFPDAPRLSASISSRNERFAKK